MTLVLGIDPGIKGAIARISVGTEARVVDLPIRKSGLSSKLRNEVDPIALREELRRFVRPDEKAFAVMEELNAFIAAGRLGSTATVASLASTKAVIRTICELMGMPVVHVSPREWQSFYGISSKKGESTKKQSLRIARDMFGSDICRLEKHDGRADALLIANWARHNLEII